MYRIKVKGRSIINSDNQVEAYLDVLISDRRCSRPLIQFSSSSSSAKNIESNTNEDNDYKDNPTDLITIHNTKPATIPVSVFSACPQSNEMNFTWDLYNVDPLDYKTNHMGIEKKNPIS